HSEHTDKVIDGLHLIFVELPKFNPHTYSEKKMQVLWLRYLTEIDGQTREVAEDLMSNPEVNKAVTALEESAFTEAQLLGYEKFWDIISVEKTLYNSAIRKGMKQGMQQGIEQGIEQGMQQGIEQGIEVGHEEEKSKIARKMKSDGLPVDIISKYTGLSTEEIANF
ncbi:MAG: Rpn family recombination-promoting nuclease/putative transposase, partial [Bacteroides sp.]